MMSVWSALRSRRRKPVDISPCVHAARGNSRTQVLGAIDNSQALPEPEHFRESEAVIRSVSSKLDGVYLFNTQPLHLALLLEGAAGR